MSKGYKRPFRGKTSKYGAQKTVVDGITFDSRKEARRYRELVTLQDAGLISDLKRQFRFLLIPAQREPDTVGKRGGKIRGKVIEREVVYVADFVYMDVQTGETVVEDVKGMRTDTYILKRKLLLYTHGIRIREV